MFPPKAEKIQSKTERDTQVMEFFGSPITKRYEQRREISFRLYIFFKQRCLQPSLLKSQIKIQVKTIINNRSLNKYKQTKISSNFQRKKENRIKQDSLWQNILGAASFNCEATVHKASFFLRVGQNMDSDRITNYRSESRMIMLLRAQTTKQF